MSTTRRTTRAMVGALVVGLMALFAAAPADALDRPAAGEPTALGRAPMGFNGHPDDGVPSPSPPREVSADEHYITAAYQDFFDRAPTENELLIWSSWINRYSRSDLPTALAGSDEWVGALVDGYYADTLDRGPDPGSRQIWIAEITSGRRTPARVAAHFYSSDEYHASDGGGDDETWVRSLYSKLLDRDADDAGAAFWVTRLQSVPRPTVSLQLYQSIESRGSRVEDLYLRLLGRSADPGGLHHWVDQLGRDGNDVRLAVRLATSNEYYDRAQP